MITRGFELATFRSSTALLSPGPRAHASFAHRKLLPIPRTIVHRESVGMTSPKDAVRQQRRSVNATHGRPREEGECAVGRRKEKLFQETEGTKGRTSSSEAQGSKNPGKQATGKLISKQKRNGVRERAEDTTGSDEEGQEVHSTAIVNYQITISITDSREVEPYQKIWASQHKTIFARPFAA